MNPKLDRLLNWFREESVQAIRRYPVEILLFVYCCAGCLYSYEADSQAWMPRLALAPLFAILALAVNNYVGVGSWRKIYWVCWTPILPFSLWSGLDRWIETPSAWITFGVLAPLLLLLCRRAVQNDRFVCDVVVWLRASVLAMFFANVALGLFCAIFFSTTYIFGLNGDWIEHVAFYAVIVFETLVAPILLLMMSVRWAGGKCRGSRVGDTLINYIVTPALLIYTAILGLYMVKILVSWELPRGGVAYLVFGFTITALIVQALQCLLQKRIYDWFFNRFSLIALSTQVLFWIGALRRVDEYGLTQPRVYLLVCGVLMTLCVLLFLTRYTGRYLWVALAAFVCFAAMAYVPGLDAKSIALCSQKQRAILRLTNLPEESKTTYHCFALPDNIRMKFDAQYPNLVVNPSSWGADRSYDYENDTLSLYLGHQTPVWQLSGAELLRQQADLAGLTIQTFEEELSPQSRIALLNYRDDFCLIVFRNMDVKRTDSTLVLTDLKICLIQLR